MDTNKNQKTKLFQAISLGMELGFLIVLPLIVFLILGLFLDRKLDSLPLFLIVFIILSLVTIFLEVRYLVIPFLERKVGNEK